MFVIPGLAVLVIYVYLRLHEVFEALRSLSINHVLLLVGLGYLLDVATAITRPRITMMLVCGSLFFIWALITVGIRAPERIGDELPMLTASLATFLFMSQGVQTLRGFRISTTILLAITIFLTLVGVHQSLTPKVCIRATGVDQGMSAAKAAEYGEERPCDSRYECRVADPGHDYLCESRGILDTHSIGGRVRYRGIFQDPNELAWAISMGLPLIFTWFERKRSSFRLICVLVVFAACTMCTIKTQSRSGQIALAATLAAYFIRRLGWRGVVVTAVVALPVMLLGGRTGEEADSSRLERLECWSEALSMWHDNPLFGVGAKQFTQHHFLTAHSSFMLVLAELGPLGLILWTLLLYSAFKIVIRIQRDFADRPEAVSARGDAFALLAGLVSMTVSTFFLSIAYHPAVWMEFGLVGAIQAAVSRHDPEWRIRWSWRDLAFVLTFDVVLVAYVAVYLKMLGI